MQDVDLIKYALYLQKWNYEDGDKQILRDRGTRIQATDYHEDMKGHIFCSECSAPLFRSPEKRDYAKNGRKAFFAHARSIKSECSLRVRRSPGKTYINEEEAKQAVANGELIVISALMAEKPEAPQIDGPVFYEVEPNEAINGPVTDAAIGRHNGEIFKLPSKITTIRGLCRSFDEKLNTYFLLPGQQAAKTLRDQLTPISNIKEKDLTPRLYIGKVSHHMNMGPQPHNIRQIFLEFNRTKEYRDLCIKAEAGLSDEHGITQDVKGRILIAYGPIRTSGTGLAIPKLGWGEFALLPQQYEYLIHHW